MKKSIFLVGLCMVFLLVSAIQVSSAPPGLRLSGTYYLQGTETCVYTTFFHPPAGPYSGFDNTFQIAAEVDASTRSYHQEGTLVLDRDGTGYVEFSSMLINHQAITVGKRNPVRWTGECFVSYANLPDGSNTIAFDNCAGTYKDQNWLDVDAGFYGYTMNLVVSGSSMLFLSGTDYIRPPERAWIETGIGLYEAERACARTLTAVKDGS